MFDTENLRRELFKLQDENYRDFQAKIVPNVAKDKFIGIRTPVLREFVKNYFHDGAEEFLNDLPHKYFEENSIHALLLSEIKNFAECLTQTKIFLPYVDNWATCDSIMPKIFKNHTAELEIEIFAWLKSKNPYTVRFALNILRIFYLEENFDLKYLETAAKVKLEDYYAQMMTAWLFATALAKNFDATIRFLSENSLQSQIYKKIVRKALDSRKISAEQKIFLRGLKL